MEQVTIITLGDRGLILSALLPLYSQSIDFFSLAIKGVYAQQHFLHYITRAVFDKQHMFEPLPQFYFFFYVI